MSLYETFPGVPHTKTRRFWLAVGALATMLVAGIVMGTVSPETEPGAQGFAAGTVMTLVVVAGSLAHRAAERHRGTGYDVVEPVQIASDDAYDHADALPDGRTVVEDKRTAQCYEATYGGDRRVA